MKFNFHVHGLWIIGTICLLLGSMIAGNIAYVEGTTTTSYILSLLITFILLLSAGVFWISAAVNAKTE
ncbi:MAG: hypothetical protein DRP08_00170 [Candidatus Aenigmatarchaeota archaeon]|nr:hypothetical protein [Candidatus Aenigmarchaeota archaeon]RLJ05035.1 MAG: hypothetical protein DRP08_00170 [Candidatus Aenigmarchaeota archaeon]